MVFTKMHPQKSKYMHSFQELFCTHGFCVQIINLSIIKRKYNMAKFGSMTCTKTDDFVAQIRIYRVSSGRALPTFCSEVFSDHVLTRFCIDMSQLHCQHSSCKPEFAPRGPKPRMCCLDLKSTTWLQKSLSVTESGARK